MEISTPSKCRNSTSTSHKPKIVWPKGVAVGRLSVARSEQRDPRFCLDSTIANVNAQVQIEEKSFNPYVEEIVSAKVVTHSSEGVGLTIDVSKAHRRPSHPRRRMEDSIVPAPWQTLSLHSVSLGGTVQRSMVEPDGGSAHTHLPPVHFPSARWVAACRRLPFSFGSDNGAAHDSMHLLLSAPPGMLHQLAQDCLWPSSTMGWP